LSNITGQMSLITEYKSQGQTLLCHKQWFESRIYQFI